MLIPFIAALTLVVAQAPATTSSAKPLTVLLAPTDVARGTPRYLIGTAQEHVAEQLKARGLEVVRVEDVTRTLPKKKRTAMMRCNRTQPSCIASLGVAAKTDVVMVTEVGPYLNAYKAGVRVYTAQDGAPLVEHSVPGVTEDQVLDALSKSLDVVVPRTLRVLRPEPVAPPPQVVIQPPTVTPGDKQPVTPGVSPGVEPPTRVDLGDAPRVETPGRRKWAWVPAAGGVVLAGVGTVFLVQSRSKFTDLDENEFPTLAEADAARDSGKRSQTIGVVGIGVGAAAVVTGALLYFLPTKQSSVQPSVTLTPQGGGLSVAGTWQ
ncbi:hypothetical protein D7Y13_40830 [Corallococcus praedator]|uniref:Uncharacterized protein n=1 Tax=Corallococcus praedator TaxID=2316724 RepID=A0ABX9Q4X3_9BACT|nr:MULTISPECIES: hypothetical protein [Corallococcus]RKG96805.1 hypothetical protein D7X74_41270 [Corallococcus sp. CA047B]RKH18044.1 hypothetical protein D7X75_39900 [Corallococcus sp. CA031C]RKH89251.1 hypothetical protein D7Y13_40830 [Corallococcus praedator]